ncbi:MAG: hypothetical protein KGL39_19590 [Patescibacteria group bacterium]|nr:hypothetical protein [Patescibacteria group bacterium]
MDNETNKPDSGLMRRIRLRWEKELEQSSVEANSFWQLKLFGETEEDFIRKEVERKLYLSQLPNGGDMERRIVERLKKISRLKDFADAWRAGLLLKKWLKVLPEDPRNAGHYYTRTPMTPRTSKEDYEWITERLKAAKAAKDWEKKWFYELLLDGPPEPCANFKIDCKFLLKAADGDIQRLVELRNDVGEAAGPVNMDCEAFHAPQKFRKWCLARGNFNWGAGEKELQKLHNDIGRLAAWRVVNQVVTLGWLPLAGGHHGEGVARDRDGNLVCNGLWFFGDCVRANYVGPDGQVVDEWLTPDADGIHWHRTTHRETGEPVDEGYLLSDTGWEGTIKVPFYQNKPLLNPAQRITELPLQLAPCEELGFAGTIGVKPEAALVADKAREEMLLCAFFRELCQRVYNTVGGEEANLMIGSFLAYAAAPEIYAQHSLFPGLWVHGQASSGKSTIVELLMSIWGFQLHSGMMLKGNLVSAVGLAQSNSQYSNLPVWADEYINGEVDDEKMSILHAGYNRQTPAKFNASGFRRLMRTNFIVSGESTSNKAAMRSRYPHIQMSASSRLPRAIPGTENYESAMREQEANFRWLQDHQKYFHVFGRYVIEHRREFVAQVQTFMESWSKERIDPRLRIMHGVGFASWMAMASLLQSHSYDEISRFKTYMVGHSQRAHEDVQSDHNTNVTIEEMVTACKMQAIPWQCFKVLERHVEHAPDAPNQNRVWCPAKSPTNGWVSGWYEYILLIDPDPMLAALNIWLTKQRQALPLKRKDLRDQLSKSEFWYQLPEDPKTKQPKKLNVRFGVGNSTSLAWGIIADKHPLGYRKITDEEFMELDETGDPRKGPLFKLIEWVLNEYRQAEREDNP